MGTWIQIYHKITKVTKVTKVNKDNISGEKKRTLKSPVDMFAKSRVAILLIVLVYNSCKRVLKSRSTVGFWGLFKQ
jgi:hypothetical protein